MTIQRTYNTSDFSLLKNVNENTIDGIFVKDREHGCSLSDHTMLRDINKNTIDGIFDKDREHGCSLSDHTCVQLPEEFWDGAVELLAKCKGKESTKKKALTGFINQIYRMLQSASHSAPVHVDFLRKLHKRAAADIIMKLLKGHPWITTDRKWKDRGKARHYFMREERIVPTLRSNGRSDFFVKEPSVVPMTIEQAMLPKNVDISGEKLPVSENCRNTETAELRGVEVCSHSENKSGEEYESKFLDEGMYWKWNHEKIVRFQKKGNDWVEMTNGEEVEEGNLVVRKTVSVNFCVVEFPNEEIDALKKRVVEAYEEMGWNLCIYDTEHAFSCLVDEHLTDDVVTSSVEKQWFERNKPEGLKDGETLSEKEQESLAAAQNVTKIGLEKLRKGEYNAHRSSGRLFHCASNISASVRDQFKMTHKGKVEDAKTVDMSSTFPWLLGGIAHDQELLNDIVSGNLYEHVMEVAEDEFGYEGKTYAQVKADFQCHVLFNHWDKGFTGHPLYKAFRKLYPETSNFVYNYRVKHPIYGAQNLSRMLMKIECQIFIYGALRKATEEGIPCLPIHDALVCPASESERVKQIILECAQEVTGYVPRVKIS